MAVFDHEENALCVFLIRSPGQTSNVFFAFQNSHALRHLYVAEKFRFLYPTKSGSMFDLQNFVVVLLLLSHSTRHSNSDNFTLKRVICSRHLFAHSAAALPDLTNLGRLQKMFWEHDMENSLSQQNIQRSSTLQKASPWPLGLSH